MSNGAQHSLIGHTLADRYVVQRVLGTGAMGTVYCARQIELGACVAIKVLHPRLATDPELVQRFEREAFATSRLEHPNALRVLDFGQDGDLFYLVTEYVEAEDLLTIMEAAWPLADERIVAILSQVLSALIAVHDVGIVHRDLKPENILVLAERDDDGKNVDFVKVCDFGIAKFARSTLQSRPFAPRLTAQGVVMGTPDYMSPEQARGHAVDGRSDLYSVGVVLYHLLAGRTPFEGDSPVGIALQHVSEPPVPPSQIRNVHPGLEGVCLRALSKRPEDRFQTAREMRKALRDALTMPAPSAALVPARETSLRVSAASSTASPALLSPRSLRQTLARGAPLASARRRTRMALGYAAISVVTITASAFIASRSSTADPAEPAQMVAAMGLVSPLIRAPELPSTMPPPGASAETLVAMSDAPAAPPPVMSEPVRPAPRPRSQPAPALVAKAEPHTLIVAVTPPPSPIASPPPRSGPVLVRSDPWPSPKLSAAAPAPTARGASAAPGELTAIAPAAPPRPQVPSRPTDTTSASVAFSNVITSAGISGSKVKVSLSHVPLQACYQQALRSRPSEAALDTELRLTIDVGGRVVSAALSKDDGLPGLRSCIESAARGMQIRDVDTGDGYAIVHLRFSTR
jgi:serine/threonine-protein kinase